ncbi:maleylpyruvate isomerase family mycothiol-dependent enzyme [Streptomyces sp. PSKA54]|uniref:Maleylpyruvate isomerase family mycothiol-dependent enzyme n=1 Tax=Streptomyces himalayensis subsp. aureolus TaxID=2758039 RepID=A0A7W2CX01_9ACTN|nr:maleylpyruvate isomerase family mycothiol-dependent enzyme [Streptomyces himalayensis]MBA4860648.1 maleylpyruvate isomerase family mycothiol-dependent enzyme [Streptomyces himalayensis subsp. aureolus]
MDTSEHIHTLEAEGRLLAVAAEEAGPDAKVPTCPGWEVRDLLRHTGMVHRWAATFVAEGRTSYHPDGGLPDLDGGELLAWFRAGHRALVETLATAPPDVACWSFLPAPSPLAFWARRQAHETAVHRVDAESARGGTPETIGTDFAVDGIDELLCGFHARPRSKVRTEEPRLLRVRATDTDAVWTVRISADPPVTERDDAGEADCEVSGPAARLYLSLWNRLPFPRVTGDSSLTALWREKSGVT